MELPTLPEEVMDRLSLVGQVRFTAWKGEEPVVVNAPVAPLHRQLFVLVHKNGAIETALMQDGRAELWVEQKEPPWQIRVIGRAVALLAGHDIEFTLIGTGQDLEATRRECAGDRRVRWIDWVEPARLPELVASHDVCLGIFGTGPKALRVVPNKVFQGASAGCAVVTSDTKAQRAALADGARFVPPGDAGALAAELARLEGSAAELSNARRAAYERAEQAFRGHEVVLPLRRSILEVRG